jgi:hypothetical protein
MNESKHVDNNTKVSYKEQQYSLEVVTESPLAGRSAFTDYAV